MKELIIVNTSLGYERVMHYLYSNYEERFDSFEYITEALVKNYEYMRRRNKLSEIIKICNPRDINTNIEFNGKTINIEIKPMLKINQDPMKLLQSKGCNSMEEINLKELILRSDEKDILFEFVESANKFCKQQIDESKKITKKTMNIHFWKKDYWHLISQNPKRPLKTLYLKEGYKEEIIEKVSEFFSEDTRDEYISHGIPYKNVFMLYGVPGSGKTSTINTIASHFDCDIYVIPISKELSDYDLITAISYMDDSDDKGSTRKKIIVIEDIDSIFTDRKKGDDNNGITLPGLLNCFDGFSCIEGTLLFITANKPEVMDSAMLRSCRIDHRYELSYADKYQTESIFNEIIKHKTEENSFKTFYKQIKNRKYTTAMLQEFLFYNRKSTNINEKIIDFFEIIDKNKLSSFQGNNSSEKLYS